MQHGSFRIPRGNREQRAHPDPQQTVRSLFLPFSPIPRLRGAARIASERGSPESQAAASLFRPVQRLTEVTHPCTYPSLNLSPPTLKTMVPIVYIISVANKLQQANKYSHTVYLTFYIINHIYIIHPMYLSLSICVSIYLLMYLLTSEYISYPYHFILYFNLSFRTGLNYFLYLYLFVYSYQIICISIYLYIYIFIFSYHQLTVNYKSLNIISINY